MFSERLNAAGMNIHLVNYQPLHQVAPHSCYAFAKAYQPGRHAFISMLRSCPVLQNQLQAELLSAVEQLTSSVIVSKNEIFI